METAMETDPTAAYSDKPVVNIQNLNFSYDKDKPNISGLNCVIPPNAKVILVGANGAGKSTLLRIFTGVIRCGPAAWTQAAGAAAAASVAAANTANTAANATVTPPPTPPRPPPTAAVS